MDEYLSEKEQWEALLGWVRANGLWIVAGIVAGGFVVAGISWWHGRTDRLALQAGSQYEHIVDAFAHGQRERALKLLDQLEQDQPSSPYTDQANLAAARVLVEAGDLGQASTHLSAVMEKARDPALARVARLRLARVQIAQNKPDAALATLAGADTGAFAPRYHEVRGEAYHAKGDDVSALKEYRAARSGDSTLLVDAQTLDLKIADLLAEQRSAPASAAAAR